MYTIWKGKVFISFTSTTDYILRRRKFDIGGKGFHQRYFETFDTDFWWCWYHIDLLILDCIYHWSSKTSKYTSNRKRNNLCFRKQFAIWWYWNYCFTWRLKFPCFHHAVQCYKKLKHLFLQYICMQLCTSACLYIKAYSITKKLRLICWDNTSCIKIGYI